MRFYTQQVAATFLIFGSWLLVILTLTRQPGEPANFVEIPQQAPRGKFVPRDESTGEICRIEHMDALGGKTHVEIKFQDGAVATVYYDLLQRRRRAVEVMPDGSRQIYTFAANGRSLLKHESFRADGTLKSETVPVDQDSACTVHYDADGRTRLRQQVFRSDGGTETTVFAQDGTTAKWICKCDKTNRSEVLTFGEDGRIVSRDTVERGFIPGFMLLPIRTLKLEHTRYHPDGQTVWYRQKWSVIGISKSLLEVEQFDQDGKTLRLRLSKLASAPGLLGIGAQQEQRKLELFDQQGKAVVAKVLRSDYSVVSEQTVSGDGTPVTRDVAAGAEKEQLPDFLLAEPAALQIDQMLLQWAVQPEPNHYRQIVSN